LDDAIKKEGLRLMRALDGICGQDPLWLNIRSLVEEAFGSLEQEAERLDRTMLRATQSELLDVLQVHFGDSPKWDRIKHRVFNACGQLGLARLI
jgi:hypothetical protein